MEETFKHSSAVILCDDMLEGIVGEGYIWMEDGIGDGIGKCSGHDDIGLA